MTDPFISHVLTPGFYKYGYVTNDRDQAIDVLQKSLGIEEFVPFSPTFTVTTDDGQTGEASLDCAFSAGRDIFIEALEPKSGLVDVFSSSLTDSDEFQLVLHHISVIVDDLEAVKASAAAVGITPAIEAHLSTGMSFTYMKMPDLGLWIEHDQYDGDSRSFLDSIANRPLPEH
jgi:hypothetical protein